MGGVNDECAPVNYLTAQFGNPVEIAATTSRVFLGVQIQCAKCHDAKTEPWRREQFHQFAAFFGRARLIQHKDVEGRATPYALENLQERGSLFVGAGESVYEGQVVGEHCRDNDLPVNACREKKLTNVRSATSEKTIILKPPRQMTMELALEYIEEDELVEVTPSAIRMRKMYLKENDRKKQARQSAS